MLNGTTNHGVDTSHAAFRQARSVGVLMPHGVEQIPQTTVCRPSRAEGPGDRGCCAAPTPGVLERSPTDALVGKSLYDRCLTTSASMGFVQFSAPNN